MNFIKEKGLSFFEKYQETGDLLKAFEAKKIYGRFFGEDPDWQNYNIGIIYYNAGRFAESIEYFEKVLKCPGTLDWQVRRGEWAKIWIEKMQ